jgi:hypothetical protein
MRDFGSAAGAFILSISLITKSSFQEVLESDNGGLQYIESACAAKLLELLGNPS